MRLRVNDGNGAWEPRRRKQGGWNGYLKRRDLMRKRGLIRGTPTTHNPHDMVRIKKLKKTVRQAKKVGAKLERQARELKDLCQQVLSDLDTGWES
jgi:hypothetical protein